ncbi:MAG: hypothetical protein HY722_04795 [Planctomycetes bacterium]|nr:hypothetical protein [Planctomycetota bacterium]
MTRLFWEELARWEERIVLARSVLAVLVAVTVLHGGIAVAILSHPHPVYVVPGATAPGEARP